MSHDFVEDFLVHYGVKGMKWGVRKSRGTNGSTFKSRYRSLRDAPLLSTEVKAKNGDTVSVKELQSGKLASFLNSFSEKHVREYKNVKHFDMTVNGRKVGDASYEIKDSGKEMNLVWMGVKNKERGKGYATAAFKAAVEHGKTLGVEKLTLEVPGNSPDALHIYKKAGFKEKGLLKDSDPSDVWGGLTVMEYKVSGRK